MRNGGPRGPPFCVSSRWIWVLHILRILKVLENSASGTASRSLYVNLPEEGDFPSDTIALGNGNVTFG